MRASVRVVFVLAPPYQFTTWSMLLVRGRHLPPDRRACRRPRIESTTTLQTRIQSVRVIVGYVGTIARLRMCYGRSRAW
ncbi:unnamed protein product [Peniophora sp. CBMAI 1063]|nr:unnamed protein product [Peniophora sp. CBMAI 1063]